MSEETDADARSPRRVIERYYGELYNQHRLDLAPTLIAAETWRYSPGAAEMLTIDQTMARLEAFFERFPEAHFEHGVCVVDGDKVASAWNGHLTLRSGRQIETSGIEIFRVVDGKIVETWNQDPPGNAGFWPASGNGKL